MSFYLEFKLKALDFLHNFSNNTFSFIQLRKSMGIKSTDRSKITFLSRCLKYFVKEGILIKKEKLFVKKDKNVLLHYSEKLNEALINGIRKEYKCEICKTKFFNKNAFDLHLCEDYLPELKNSKIKNQVIEDNLEKEFKCKHKCGYCLKVFDTWEKLQNHSCPGESFNPKKCRFCGDIFSRNYNRKLHENLYHNANNEI